MICNNLDAEFIIVGGGIMGVCAGFFLSERPREILLFERKGVGEEASGRNAGSLSIQNKPYPLIPLCKGGLETWKELTKEIKGLEYAQPGGFRVAVKEEEHFRLLKDLEAQRDAGLDVVNLPGTEVRKRAPYFSCSIKSANYCPLDGYVDARIATQYIAQATMARGVHILTNSPVEKIRCENQKTVAVFVRNRWYRSRKLLIAAGVWTRQLAKTVGVELPINLRINQVIVTVRSPRLIEHMITHAAGNLTLKQLACGSILIGGGWPGLGDLDREVKQPRFESIIGNLSVATQVVPELSDIEIIRTWAGFDGRTNDELPILGQLSNKKNIFIASSCFGGYVAGPYIGKILAQLMIGQRPDLCLADFSPRRFE